MTNNNLKIAKILSLPCEMDRKLLVESLLGAQFAMYHDLKRRETFLATENEDGVETVKKALPGAEFAISEKELSWPGRKRCIIAFPASESEGTFDVMYRIFGGAASALLVSFAPVNKKYISEVKGKVEERISQKDIRLTKSLSTRLNSYSETDALQRDLYYESDERKALIGILESLDGAMLANGTAYKTTILIDYGDMPLYAYLKSRLLILDEFETEGGPLSEILDRLRGIDAIPNDAKHVSMMLGFSDRTRMLRTINTVSGLQVGGIVIGNYLEGSVRETEQEIGISEKTLNLGTLVTGVPGTGKTFAARRIVEEVMKERNSKSIVISPTEEWNAVGRTNRSYVISPYLSKVPINFFKCDASINLERFYENLAMLLASASNAGPYQDSLEKCLLAAFHKVYRNTRAPDPVEVYNAIEAAIIEQHSTKTNASVKYTKHGENVKASLENLRLMLNRPEFAFADGIDFGAILEKGVVFDLSNVSNKMKPFFYALILGQTYGFSDSLDILGDNALRMLICLEEAQLIFGREEKSAATADLKQRIQDFRKKGVGLILITHNVTDIEPSIRRLCQTKLYFRQSSDVAKFAADDLPFNETEREAVIERLKTLEHRICALSRIENSATGKNMVDSVFVKISQQSTESPAKVDEVTLEVGCRELVRSPMKIRFTGVGGESKSHAKAEVFYVGEKIFEGESDNNGFILVEGVISGKKYRVAILGEKKRDTKAFDIIAGKDKVIVI